MFGEMNQEEMTLLLSRNIFGRIGCNDGKRTYVYPISYAFHNNTIYCYSKEGHKLAIMRDNPSVCFQVDEVGDMANWKSVICWGTFNELTGPPERRAAIQHLADRVLPLMSSETTHIFPHWPFPPDDMNEIEGVVFEIKVDEVTGRYERFHRLASSI